MDAHSKYSANSQYGEQPNQLLFELLSKIDLMLGKQWYIDIQQYDDGSQNKKSK